MSPSEIGVTAVITGVSADVVFERMADFGDFGVHVPLVDYITVEHDADGLRSSSWSVHFRGGLLQWVERDTVDPEARTVMFEQSSGDLGSFAGRWAVTDGPGDTVTLCFDAAVDIGIPSMADMLNPVAASELATGVHRIVTGVFGDRAAVRPPGSATGR